MVECYLQSDPKAVVGSLGGITTSAGLNNGTKKLTCFLLQDPEQQLITLAYYLLLSTQISNTFASISR